jgi:hypothetical protein
VHAENKTAKRITGVKSVLFISFMFWNIHFFLLNAMFYKVIIFTIDFFCFIFGCGFFVWLLRWLGDSA